MKKISLYLFFCLLPYLSWSQEFTDLATNIQSSFRGLDSYKNQAIWVSGSNGQVGRYLLSSKTWQWTQVKGYEKFDFRDIVAFSAKEAVVVSAGSPAVILRTTDAGKNWKEVYRNDDPAIFLDDMEFTGKHGYILGDPIGGQFQLLESKNKGKTWKDVTEEIPLIAEEGEAAFAASGSSMQMLNDWLYIGTGGKVASLMKRNLKQNRLDVQDAPIWSGENGTGIFSIAFLNQRVGVVVGGNYMDDKNNSNNILLTKNGGLSWEKPITPVFGYRSCVKYIDENTLIATGTSGTDLSLDGGMNWKKISDASFNVIEVSKDGQIYLAGSNGNVVKVDLIP